MHANSRQVSSNQPHLHRGLAALVRKHLDNPCRKPVAAHSARAYGALQDALAETGLPLILDSFCGTGHSTVYLAAKFPGHLVAGIDKSAHRLGKGPDDTPQNCRLLQADCADIWKLLAADGIATERHYLLYPNPWPKARHLARRVHGHPAFAFLLQLGGQVELRSNWQLYVEEFGLAMYLAGTPGYVRQLPQDLQPMTRFERKYRDSGHSLWSYCADVTR